jgi:HSP20 family molecular chaperone IbpA
MKSVKSSNHKAELLATVLCPRNPEILRAEMQPVQLAIARRAFELFEKRGGELGHDWEDWFQAETELLRPVSIVSFESQDRLSLRAYVLGFGEGELQVSIEPKRVAIFGRREVAINQTGDQKIEYIDGYPDQVLRLIDLPTEVDPERAVVELHAGMLKFELPKTAKLSLESMAAAA